MTPLLRKTDEIMKKLHVDDTNMGKSLGAGVDILVSKMTDIGETLAKRHDSGVSLFDEIQVGVTGNKNGRNDEIGRAHCTLRQIKAAGSEGLMLRLIRPARTTTDDLVLDSDEDRGVVDGSGSDGGSEDIGYGGSSSDLLQRRDENLHLDGSAAYVVDDEDSHCVPTLQVFYQGALSATLNRFIHHDVDSRLRTLERHNARQRGE